jgi:hypothetical protein
VSKKLYLLKERLTVEDAMLDIDPDEVGLGRGEDLAPREHQWAIIQL